MCSVYDLKQSSKSKIRFRENVECVMLYIRMNSEVIYITQMLYFGYWVVNGLAGSPKNFGWPHELARLACISHEEIIYCST